MTIHQLPIAYKNISHKRHVMLHFSKTMAS